MKKFASILALAFTFACGAPADYLDAAGIDDEGDAGGELGTAEQAYISLNGQAKQWGTKTGASNRSCDKTSTGQVCTFSKFKTIDVARSPAQWTAEQNDQLSLMVFELNQEYGGANGWQFLFSDSAVNPPASAVRIIIQNNSGGGGNNGNDVLNYNSVQFVSPTQLTEGLNGGAVAGNYQTHGSCIAQVFTSRINTKTTNANQRLRLLDHAAGNTVVRCMGVGTDANAINSYSQSPINLSSFLNGATTGEKCRANFSVNNTTDYSRVTQSACPSD